MPGKSAYKQHEKCKNDTHEWVRTSDEIGDLIIWKCRKCRYSVMGKERPLTQKILATQTPIGLQYKNER